MLPGYPSVRPSRRLDRAVRTLIVAAGAALIGVIAGGISVLAVVSALTAPPRHDTRAEAAKGSEKAVPTGPVIAALPRPAKIPPSQTETSVLVTPQTTDQVVRLPGASPETTKQEAGMDRVNRTDSRAGASESSAPGSGDVTTTSRSGLPARAARNTGAAKRRVVVASPAAQPALDDNTAEQPADHMRGFFDFFDDEHLRQGQGAAVAPDAVAPRGSELRQRQGATKPRAARRRRPDDVTVSERAQGRAIIVPGQPAYSDAPRDRSDGGLLGFFGSSGRGQGDWHD